MYLNFLKFTMTINFIIKVVNLGLDKYDLNIQSDISLIYEKEQKETINKIKNLGKKTRICQK